MLEKDFLNQLKEFTELYTERPFKVNSNGMRFNHSFAIFSMLKILKPDLVVESGVDKGHSTWLIENSSDAKIICIDPKPYNIIYKSKRADYFEEDFSGIDWTKYDKKNSLCIFDDHQNAYSRLLEMKWWGFKEAIFEDNFPIDEGDSYSLKQAIAGTGHKKIQLSKGFKIKTLRGRVVRRLEEKILFRNYWRQNILRKENKIDNIALNLNLQEYYEIPPVYVGEMNHFNKGWSDNYKIENGPLLKKIQEIPNISKILENIPEEELTREFSYCYITYVKLKD